MPSYPLVGAVRGVGVVLALLGGFVFVVLLWAFLPVAFNGHLFPDVAAFLYIYLGKIENLENLFSPVSAFFSSLAACGAVYAIYQQGIQFKRQQFESNLFGMFELLNQHRLRICFDVSLFGKTKKGQFFSETEENQFFSEKDAIEKHYLFLKMICISANKELSDGTEIHLNPAVSGAIEQILSQFRDDDGNISRDIDKNFLFREAYKIYILNTKCTMHQYFRFVYRILKYIDANSDKKYKREHVGTLRAQFNGFEFALLHYNGLMHEDRGEKKALDMYKKMDLLQNKERSLLFDSETAGKYRT